MEARVKSTWPFRTLQALAGREFCKDEWRPVLPGFEAEAAKHPWLETREPKPGEPESVTVSTETPGQMKSKSVQLKPHTTVNKGRGGKR